MCYLPIFHVTIIFGSLLQLAYISVTCQSIFMGEHDYYNHYFLQGYSVHDIHKEICFYLVTPDSDNGYPQVEETLHSYNV